MRALLAAALAASLAGCLPELPEGRSPHMLVPPPPPSGIRKMPVTFQVDVLREKKTRGVTLDVFDTGSIRVRGEAVSALKSYHSKIAMDVPVFVFRHPTKGLILYGTGLSPDKKRRPEALFSPFLPYAFKYKQKKKEDIESQMIEAGLDPADVSVVVLPHLDADSAGMYDAFPEARVVVSAAEWEWRKSRRPEGSEPGPLDPETLEKSLKNIDIVNLGVEPAFGSFENGKDLLGDGVLYLVALPGRTPGNVGLWAELDEGPVLLMGGAAYVVDNYLDLALPVKQHVNDLEEYWRSLHIARAMREQIPRLLILPGNDLAHARLLRREDMRFHAR